MIGSILAIVTFSGNYSGDQPPTDNELPSDFSDVTTLQMTADNVEARVVEILPKVLFTAYTNEAEILEIDSRIASVEGIYKIDSKYKQQANPTFNTSLAYIAEISFQKEKNALEIVSEINQKTEGILFDSFAYGQVLVSVPKNVYFENEQGFDLDYEFQDPLILSYTITEPRKQDNLLIRIDASFSGSTMLSSIASETRNLTGELQYLLFDETKEVEEKLPRMIFGSETNYSDYVEEGVLKAQIISLGAVDVNISAFKPENYFIAYFSAETDLEEEFNSLLSDQNELINSIEVYEETQGFSVKVDFRGENSVEVQDIVVRFLEDKNASDISVEESFSQIFGSIELSSADSEVFVLELQAFLDSLNFQRTSIQQQVVVSFGSFVSEDGAEFFPDEETLTETFVNASRAVGEEVELKIQIQVIRDKLISITASEQ